jgi:hypothetical protein
MQPRQIRDTSNPVWPSFTYSIPSGAGRTAGDVAAEVKAARDQGLARYRQVMNSDETPINPYRVYGDLMEVLDLRNSFVTHESGNTRDQLSTVFDTLIPRGFLGWGNVSTLGFSLAAAIAAKKAFPDRASVAVTGERPLRRRGRRRVLAHHRGLTDRGVHLSRGRQCRRHAEGGINFFDTANRYSLGSSEEILGRAIKDFTRRDASLDYDFGRQGVARQTAVGPEPISPPVVSVKDFERLPQVLRSLVRIQRGQDG